MDNITFIIQKIASLQSKGEDWFDDGLFPAYRANKLIGYSRPDTTIFFSAIVAFTLQRLRPILSKSNQQIVGNIVNNYLKNCELFQNKDGLKTYNFWKTKPSKHFPNGYIFKHFDHFRIPDDVDDTAMIYLTSKPTNEELLWLKNKLIEHANLSKLQVKNTYPDYKNLKAYSTWFGKNMYIEFDVCVLCNLLYCIYEYELPLNQHDADSLAYIRSCVETNRYLDAPFRVAHQYPRTPAIIYHIARLLGAFKIADLEPIRNKLITDAKKLLLQKNHWLDEIVLSIALLRLGEKNIPELNLNYEKLPSFEGFYFFIAGLLTAYENPLLYKLAASPLFHIQWTCEAHIWTLLAEYEGLKQH